MRFNVRSLEALPRLNCPETSGVQGRARERNKPLGPKHRGARPDVAGSRSMPKQDTDMARDQSEGGETLREKFMKKIAGDPQFQEAKKSGQAFVIIKLARQ